MIEYPRRAARLSVPRGYSLVLEGRVQRRGDAYVLQVDQPAGQWLLPRNPQLAYELRRASPDGRARGLRLEGVWYEDLGGFHLWRVAPLPKSRRARSPGKRTSARQPRALRQSDPAPQSKDQPRSPRGSQPPSRPSAPLPSAADLLASLLRPPGAPLPLPSAASRSSHGSRPPRPSRRAASLLRRLLPSAAPALSASTSTPSASTRRPAPSSARRSRPPRARSGRPS